MISKFVNIPIELCQWALTYKKVRALQVYVWLKMQCFGKIKITKEVLENMAKDFGLKSVKTVKSAIQYLMDQRWITRSKRSGYFFIKSFEGIREMKGYSARTGAEFYFSDIKKFKGFLVAAIITNLISVQKRRLWVTERKKRGSMTVSHKPPIFFPVANKALSKILGVSVSTAWEWKKLAQKKRFIKIRKAFQEIKIEPEFLPQYKKYSNSKKTVIRKGKVCDQLPDKVATNLVLRNRKKLKKSDGKKSKHIKKGGMGEQRISEQTKQQKEKPQRLKTAF